jgi:hypothetical protein
VVGLGPELAGARDVAERAAGLITFDGMQRRWDIAATAPTPGYFTSPAPRAARPTALGASA